jgi:hypothetical protein
MVFLNSPCRETPKNVLKKKVKKKKSDGGWVGLGFSKCTGGSVDFFCQPLAGISAIPNAPGGSRKQLAFPTSSHFQSKVKISSIEDSMMRASTTNCRWPMASNTSHYDIKPIDTQRFSV